MSIESIECKLTKCRVCGTPVLEDAAQSLSSPEIVQLVNRYDRMRHCNRSYTCVIDHGPRVQATLKELLELRRYKIKFDKVKQALKDIDTNTD